MSDERFNAIMQAEEAVTDSDRLATLTRLLQEAKGALDGMLSHSCVSDAAPDDKDGEDHEVEHCARTVAAEIEKELGKG